MPTKKAFLIGINKYRDGDIYNNDLKGCVNDIAQTRDFLVKQFGFLDKDIRLLADERAKKKEIWDRLVQYREEIKPNDLLVIQQSSHGTRYPIRDKKTGKLGKVVDVLCASNFTWDNPILIGPEIGKLFSELPIGAKVVFILDACHTGAQFRDLDVPIGVAKEEVSNTSNPRYIAPPVDIDHRFRGIGQSPAPGQVSPGIVLFSAADKDETAADAYILGKWRGAFTFHLWKAVEDIPGQETNMQVLSRVKTTIKAGGFSQNPGLECDPAEALKMFLNGSLPERRDESETTLAETSGFFTGYVNVTPPLPELPSLPIAFP